MADAGAPDGAGRRPGADVPWEQPGGDEPGDPERSSPQPSASRPDVAAQPSAPQGPGLRYDPDPEPDPDAPEHPLLRDADPDPQDEPPSAPSAARRLLDRLAAGAGAWDARTRSTAFVPATESVQIDERRHPFLLVSPGLRTAAGLVALLTGLRFGPLAVFAVATAVWAAFRLHPGLRTTAVVAGGATLGLVVLSLVTSRWVGALVLLLWAAEDLADWWSDRLVVTDKRIYRRYGVVTGHSPSISLMAVAYIDAAVPPLGRVFRYGTLQLDSAAQHDAPLSRFDLVPDVVAVSHEILRLRSNAMPKYPQF